MHIYRLRSGGLRIAGSDPELRNGVYGWVEFKRSPLDSYGPRMEAHLLDRTNGKDLIRPLYYARLRRIDGVMHLAGREREGRNNTKANTRPVSQSWLCAFDPADALPLLAKIHVHSPAGFSPDEEYDDDPFAPLDNL